MAFQRIRQKIRDSRPITWGRIVTKVNIDVIPLKKWPKWRLEQEIRRIKREINKMERKPSYVPSTGKNIEKYIARLEARREKLEAAIGEKLNRRILARLK